MDGLGAGFPLAPGFLELCRTLELYEEPHFQRRILVRPSRVSSCATQLLRAGLMLAGDSSHQQQLLPGAVTAPFLLVCNLTAVTLRLKREGSHGRGQHHPSGAPGWCLVVPACQAGPDAGTAGGGWAGWESPGP